MKVLGGAMWWEHIRQRRVMENTLVTMNRGCLKEGKT